MTSKAEKGKIIPSRENQNYIQPSSSSFPMWKYLAMAVQMLSLDLRHRMKWERERNAGTVHFCSNALIKQQGLHLQNHNKGFKIPFTLCSDKYASTTTFWLSKDSSSWELLKTQASTWLFCFYIEKKQGVFVLLLLEFIFPIHLTVEYLVEAHMKKEDKAWANYPNKNMLSSVKGL